MMSTALAVALILIAIMAIAAMAVVLLLVTRAKPAPRPQAVPPPGYKNDLDQVQYFSHSRKEHHEPPQPRGKQGGIVEDPRSKPLPRCIFCGTALAFGDSKCNKCGRRQGDEG
jgi:hypothetical protein